MLTETMGQDRFCVYVQKLLGITRKPTEDDMAIARDLAKIEQKICELSKEQDWGYSDVDVQLVRGPLGKRFIDVTLHWPSERDARINGGSLHYRFKGGISSKRIMRDELHLPGGL